MRWKNVTGFDALFPNLIESGCFRFNWEYIVASDNYYALLKDVSKLKHSRKEIIMCAGFFLLLYSFS